MRIVFMGTPAFAVPSLRKLVQAGKEVAAVVTAPDKPAGRGLELYPSEVKKAALDLGIPVLQPEKLRDPDFLSQLHSLKADIQVVVAFRMLPELVWGMPPIGTFNLHASLLPQYRGAAPIHWAIIRGETETGVTTFFLRHEIDTGPIVFQEKEPIDELDTAGSLYERLMHKGADLVLKTIEAVETGSYPQWPQPVVEPIQTAPKIFTETCQVDFAQSSRNVYNFIRGLSPFPGAWTRIGGLLCKVYKGTIVQGKSTALPGILDSDQKSYLHISTLDGWIALEEIQREGKKKMKIAEFLRGNRV